MTTVLLPGLPQASLAIGGALATMKLSGGSLNVYSQIGLIALIGLITKHGILIVEFANRQMEQGKDKVEAVIEASVLRLRPILMTTGAMVLGEPPRDRLGAGRRHDLRHRLHPVYRPGVLHVAVAAQARAGRARGAGRRGSARRIGVRPSRTRDCAARPCPPARAP